MWSGEADATTVQVAADAPDRAGAAGPSYGAGGPVTARGKRTRAALVTAAREIFERDGFGDARITDIADRAGVSHGTFYTYFTSKEGVFRVVADMTVGEIFTATRLGPETGDDPVSRVQASIRLYLNAYRTHAKIIMVLEEVSSRDDHFRRLWVDLRQVFADRAAARIEHLQRDGLADPRLAPATAALALGGMVEHFAHVWLALDQAFDEDHVVATLTRLWGQAIGLEVPDAIPPCESRRRK